MLHDDYGVSVSTLWGGGMLLDNVRWEIHDYENKTQMERVMIRHNFSTASKMGIWLLQNTLTRGRQTAQQSGF